MSRAFNHRISRKQQPLQCTPPKPAQACRRRLVGKQPPPHMLKTLAQTCLDVACTSPTRAAGNMEKAHHNVTPEKDASSKLFPEGTSPTSSPIKHCRTRIRSAQDSPYETSKQEAPPRSSKRARFDPTRCAPQGTAFSATECELTGGMEDANAAIQMRQHQFLQDLESAADDQCSDAMLEAGGQTVRDRFAELRAMSDNQGASEIAHTLLSERPIDELQALCLQDGLAAEGSKDELVACIIQHYAARSEKAPEASPVLVPPPEVAVATNALATTNKLVSGVAADSMITAILDSLTGLVDGQRSVRQAAGEILERLGPLTSTGSLDEAKGQTRATIAAALDILTAHFAEERLSSSAVLEILSLMGSLPEPFDADIASRCQMPAAATHAHHGGSDVSETHALCQAPAGSSPVVVPDDDSNLEVAAEQHGAITESIGEDLSLVEAAPEAPKYPFVKEDLVEDLDVWIQHSLHKLQ